MKRWRSLGALLAGLIGVGASAAAAERPTPIWIDTDPACGAGPARDVDDCWALLALLRSPHVAIRGISSVYGNGPGRLTHATLLRLLRRAGASGSKVIRNVIRGADDEEDSTGLARRTLVPQVARALEAEPLTILALGPLTNVKILLRARPDLARRIERIVAVAGQRPGQRFYTGKYPLAHVHDVNFRNDPAAFRAILEAGIRLDLIPFEVARQITIRPSDLATMAQRGDAAAVWLARSSEAWMEFWQDWLNDAGFFPFDSLAAGYLLHPAMFHCRSMSVAVVARPGLFVRRTTLEVAPRQAARPSAVYCDRVSPAFKPALLRLFR